MERSTSESERALIGSVLLSGGKALDEVSLDPEDFYEPRHESVWRIFLDMRRRGEAIDTVTVNQRVQSIPDLRGQVTPAELYSYTRDTPTTAAAPAYARHVAELATRRRIRMEALAIADMAVEAESVGELVDQARARIEQAARVNVSAVKPIGATIMQTVQNLRKPIIYTPTPWTNLNHFIGGWRPSSLYVVGARPGGGKSIMGAQAAISLTDSGAVALCSLEMSEEDLQLRIISQKSGVDMTSLLNRCTTNLEIEKATTAAQNLLNAPLFINDRAAMTLNDVRSFVRSVARQQKLGGVVVDYLQLMEATSKKERHLAVGELSRGLKLMAKELHVPVIALSQLNRGSADRPDKKPTLSDLRESGSIEQDADAVILLHREHHESDELHVNVAKNRQGPPGSLILGWRGHNSMLTD
ncbi:replicative DNA helicase [Brevibacterium sanguinis]|uniref:DNA 5'-3' helicase n=2 Tax=Brevibacterium TaxID=1696 RepID=A0A366INI5_9MICO|nr:MULTISPECIES: DnaB-like helicase C-terminal domain-containing protein [Brevibacterium]RBP66394.1 replicative DNA helicase [Brevibacterium sanguinis]RBP73046.1 replicative DNA helicase [Brevibacterium celere]